MKKIVFMLLISMACLTSYGQNSNDALLNKLVEKNILTESEADELRKESQTDDGKNKIENAAQKVREAFSTPYVRFSGYGQFLYRYTDVGSVRHNAEPKLVFLAMNGELVNNIKYYVLAEFVNPMVYEFYGEWTPCEEFNVRAGQMKTPLSIENQFSNSVLDVITSTRSISSLTGMALDVLTPKKTSSSGGRDIGIRVSGDLFNNRLEYVVGMYQGAGINTSENNNNKDFASSLYLKPISGLKIGGSVYFGETCYSINGVSPVESHVRNRWILSSEYTNGRFNARAEWLHGNDGGIEREGLYGTANWFFVPKKLNVLAKVDCYNQNKDTGSKVTDYTAGVNYYFYKNCRLQLNYTYSDFSEEWGANNSNIVLGQLQFAF